MSSTDRMAAPARTPDAATGSPRARLALGAAILEGRIQPGRVFDRTVDLAGVPDGYRAMADRQALKVLVTP